MGEFFTLLCLALMLTGVLFLHQKKGGLLCFCAVDDDIKIAPNNPSDIMREKGSPGEEAAEAYQLHCTKGNIEKAKQMGTELSRLLLGICCGDDIECSQAKTMFAYTVNRYTEEFAPDSIIAQAVLGSFYNSTRLADVQLLEDISDSAAFSQYILSERGTHAQTPGHVYSSLCGRPEDQELTRTGQKLFEEYLKLCSKALEQASFR